MKGIINKILLLAVFMLLGSNSAWAIIDKIEWFGSGEFRPNEVIKLPQSCLGNGVVGGGGGTSCTLTVYGGGTDLATEIKVSGPEDITVENIKRKHGIGSNISFILRIEKSAATTERTVTLKYPLGQDTFKIKVVRVGTIQRIEYKAPRQSLNNIIAGAPSLSVINSPRGRTEAQTFSIDRLPKNEKMILAITGTKLNNVGILQQPTRYTAQILPGGTDTHCEIEIEFFNNGEQDIYLFDAGELNNNSPGVRRFVYKGSPTDDYRQVHVRPASSGNNPGGANTGNVIGIGGSNQQPATFVDVAPRANMLNTFRRLSNFAPFNQNGLTMVRVEDRFCSGMPVNQNDFRDITIPNPVWGVTNVGTQNVSTNFSVRLSSQGQTLQEETILDLNAGQTKDFTYRRPGNSQVRVRTFSDRQGCYASPDDTSFFFEDPEFTVLVDPNSALNEAQANRNNNERRY